MIILVLPVTGAFWVWRRWNCPPSAISIPLLPGLIYAAAARLGWRHVTPWKVAEAIFRPVGDLLFRPKGGVKGSSHAASWTAGRPSDGVAQRQTALVGRLTASRAVRLRWSVTRHRSGSGSSHGSPGRGTAAAGAPQQPRRRRLALGANG